MCKLPKAGLRGYGAERQVWEVQATGVSRAGQGSGPIQSTDSGGQAPPSPAFSQCAQKENRLCASQARTQPVNRFYDQRCRNPAQQAGRVAIQGEGCLRSSVTSTSPHEQVAVRTGMAVPGLRAGEAVGPVSQHISLPPLRLRQPLSGQADTRQALLSQADL